MSVAAIFERNLADGLFTHAYCALGSLDAAKPIFEHAHLPEGRDVFDLSSMTKALVGTPLIYAQIEKGALSLDETVGQWLGGTGVTLAKPLQSLSIKKLLSHTTGLPFWRNLWVCHLGIEPPERLSDRAATQARIVEMLNRAADEIDPKPKQLYSDLSFLLLGLGLELKSGLDMAAQFDGFCRDSLKLAKPSSEALPLGYAPGLNAARIMPSRAIPTAHCAVRGRLLYGEVHDENCASLGGVTAHSGLFGSGPAVANYLHHLAKSKVGTRLIQENAAVRGLPVGQPPNESLLGWRQGADPSSLPFGAGAAMGHMGFTGTAFWVWPEPRLYAMLLTNRVISGRTRPGIAAMRREVFAELAAMGTK